jgi:Nucleotidyl transferase AbiEii toxin, Type IV TA system
MSTSKNLAASVQARLLNIAKAEGRDFGQVLTKFSLERLLYRLSKSKHADSFLLKGALLFDLWFDVPLRPTRDIDLLGFGLAELPHVMGVFDDLCQMSVEDGVVFLADSIKAAEIRKEASRPISALRQNL